MPERVQTLRSSTKGQRPTGRQPGELYTNFADRQIGVINASNAATDLVAVRYFATTSDYAIGDFVVQAGVMYRAKVAVTAGAFNVANWDAVATFDAAGGGYVSKGGDTMTGNLVIAPVTGSALLSLKKAVGANYNIVYGHVGALQRWGLFLGDANAESTGNAGSDFALNSYNDAGAYLGTPFAINRATGVVAMPNGSTTLTQPATDNDTSVATTAHVKLVIGAPPVVPKVTTVSTVDWDTLTTPGWHTELLGPNNAHHPVPGVGAYFYCLTLTYASSYPVQFAYPHGDAPSQAAGFFYRGWQSTWGPWKQIATVPKSNEATPDATTDWNTLTTPGYRPGLMYGHGPNGPSPGFGYAYFVQVFVHVAGYYVQMAYPVAGGAAASGPWMRFCEGGAWGAWRPLYSPIGEIIWYPASGPPVGFIKCNGAAVSRTTYAALFAVISTYYGVGDGSTTFLLPDLRGEFIRGFDDGRGIDASRVFGSAQGHMFQYHYHSVVGGLSGGSGSLVRASSSSTSPYDFGAQVPPAGTGVVSGTETRPRNVALLPCIRYQ